MQVSNLKEATIYDLAKQLNLSTATISRALRNNPLVKPKTRKRIHDLAQAVGYRSNQFAQNLRHTHTKTIGVIVPKLDNYFMSTVLSGMEDAASKAGYNLLISQSGESERKGIINGTTMFAIRVDGLLISCACNAERMMHFEALAKQKIPVVFFDHIIDSEHHTTVSIDNRKAAREATSHLLSQNCQNIVHVTVWSNCKTYTDRLLGFKDALLKADKVFDEKAVIYCDLSHVAGIQAAQAILQMEKMPDGVFVANDNCAASCMIALKEKGVRIPQDIAFVGFNNDPVSKIIEPNLTTISYLGYEMGEIAMSCLMNRIGTDTDVIKHDRIVLQTELMVRPSSLRMPYTQY